MIYVVDAALEQWQFESFKQMNKVSTNYEKGWLDEKFPKL